VIQELWKYKKLPLLFALLSLVFYSAFAYDLERADFIKLITLYGGLFFCFYKMIQTGKSDFMLLAGMAVALRLVFLPVIPNLSQDFYRFIWDGRMLVQGINPYLSTPESHILAQNFDIVAQSQALYDGMGALNGSHYTNYPPLNQLLFAIAGGFAGKSIVGSAIVFRIIMLLADIGIIILGKKLLQKLGLPIYHIFWYALNPFIIIEMTGNLHFEPVMLFFVLASLYALVTQRWICSAILLACSVSTKLIPLLFLPLFLQYFLSNAGQSKWFHLRENAKRIPRLLLYYVLVLATVFISFLPFLTGEFAVNFGASIALWFQNFEFNASVYYIIRWIGFQTIGWNIIADVGKILPLIVIGVLLLLTFFRKNGKAQQLITVMLLGISFYFLLSTTVHPWYAATPLLLCVFTKYRFPVVWSFTIMLSYSAYGVDGFHENLWLVGIEYVAVIGFFIWEVFVPISSSGKKAKARIELG
jgi:alpha-1,6-mannosyltransferase